MQLLSIRRHFKEAIEARIVWSWSKSFQVTPSMSETPALSKLGNGRFYFNFRLVPVFFSLNTSSSL